VAALVAWAAPALAFHDGGVADCAGCHTMHNSQDGVARNATGTGAGFDLAGDIITGAGTAPGIGYDDLLLFQGASDVCLNCHAGDGGYHVWATDQTAGYLEHGAGDFVFLTEDNINDGHAGSTNPILGHKSGHSIISAIFGTVPDPVLGSAPGDTTDPYPASAMHCTSCHDPHGTDSFRLTYQSGQTTTYGLTGSMTWDATIDATGVAVFSGPESNTWHNQYRGGYSAWCGNCHGDFHNNSGNLIHPSGELLTAEVIDAYNRYEGTADCIANPPGSGHACGSGTSGDAYLSTVPFEDPNHDAFNRQTGALATSRVACVSCHRAHATSAPDAGRWDFGVTGLDEDGHESGSMPMPNPYDQYQRSLCNKCHSQDEFDRLVDFTP
jgi:predicted CXXCH cytochrome family protein